MYIMIVVNETKLKVTRDAVKLIELDVVDNR